MTSQQNDWELGGTLVICAHWVGALPPKAQTITVSKMTSQQNDWELGGTLVTYAHWAVVFTAVLSCLRTVGAVINSTASVMNYSRKLRCL